MFHDAYTTTELLLAAAAIAIGMQVHELGHWTLGRIFGGGTFFSDYWLGVFPIQTDFETPKAMGRWQVKVTGGFPFAFAAFSLVPAWHHAIIPLGFCAGIGFATSATDMNALYHPEMWQELTAGESVTREAWE